MGFPFCRKRAICRAQKPYANSRTYKSCDEVLYDYLNFDSRELLTIWIRFGPLRRPYL
ncbi:hypothetical protein DSO57_1038599 [Entomophthora muscae]|uniref:Uncharacterized protein n=1 Tax=Entomophthora muscae TaxID=34485 RepID=A0ACC2S0Q0_9FUNG|nr:hypothetical protein DSO57_1038599 [Entomophthora muscae]